MLETLHIERLGSSAHLDRSTMVTRVRVAARVPLPLAQLVPLLPPETWTLSPCFRSVQRVLRDARGGPVWRGGRERIAFEVDRSPLARSAWSALYYEHVKTDLPVGGSAEFHNLLDIELETSRRRSELRFSLNECVESRWGALRRAGGIDVDRGHTRLEAQGPDVTHVEAVKSIRYTPFAPAELGALGVLVPAQVLNLLAAAFLTPWMERLVYDGCAAGLRARQASPGQARRRAA